MRKVFSYLRWAAFAALVILMLLVVALGIYTNTEGFREMARQQLLAAANSSMRGSFSLARIEGSIWGDITLHDVGLHYQESEIIRIPRLKLSYSLLPLLRGRLQIARAEAAQPSVQIARDIQGRWNIAEALSSDQQPSEQQSSETQLSVVLRSLIIREGDLALRLAGEAPKEFRLRNFALRGRVSALPGGVEFEAAELAAQLQSRELPQIALKGAFGYQDAGAAPTVTVQDLRLESPASRLILSGRVVDFDKSRIGVKLAIDKLAPTDVVRVFPQWPLKRSLAGTVALDGPLESLAVDADLSAERATVAGNFTVDVTAPSPRYSGTVKVANVDVRELLETQQFAGVVDGNADIQGSGFAVGQINGSAVLSVRGLQTMDWALGNLRTNATLRDGRMALKGELSGAMGGADWNGSVSLAKEPNYDFDLAVKNLDIKKISAGEKAIGGVLSFKGTFKGEGVTLEQMKARASLEILASSVGPVNLSGGELMATLGDQRIRITRGSLRTADDTLTVRGDLGTTLRQRGKLDYELRSANLTPWLALAGQTGAGSLRLAGSIQGNLAEMTARGSAKTSHLDLDGVAVGNGDIDFNLTRKNNQAVPDGTLNARLADIRAGAQLQKLDAKIALVSAPSELAHIEARAQDQFGRFHSLKGSVDYGQSELSAKLSQLSLGLPDGNWNLIQPAALIKRGDSFIVQNLRLRNQRSEATIDGYVGLSGAQALDVAIDRFPLEAIAVFLPKEQPKVTGLLALQAKVRGTAAAPQITGTLKLTDSTIAGQKYGGMAVDVSYQKHEVDLNLLIRQDAARSLSATGRLPLLLSWHDGWRSEIAGEMDLRVKSSGLSLAFLNAYTAKTVTDIGGELGLDLTVRGTPAEPALKGTFRLADGRLKANPLNVDVKSISLEGALAPRALSIKQFSARANDGQLSGRGSLSLKSYQIENLKVSLAARRWPAIDTKRYQAQVNGDIEVVGPLGAPKLTGKIEVIEANLRPDLAFLAKSSTPVKRDPTIVIVDRDRIERRETTGKKSDEDSNDSELFKNLSLDLNVRAPRNVWLRHPEALAEFRANLRATKSPGEEPELVGTTEIIRGWAGFQGRRFEFTRGEIRFVGGAEINPELDIVAQHRLPEYTVSAVVGGTAEKPSLTLRSEPNLDQADILSLLVFGKPTGELSSGEQVSLKQSALDLTSGFAAAKIGSAVAEAIGLDTLGGDLNFEGGRIGYGRYVGEKTYVTAGQDLAGEKGQEVTIEYQIGRDWKIESSTTSKGSGEVGIIWHKRY